MNGIASLGHGDDAGDRDGIESEVGGCRGRHQERPFEPNRRRELAVEDHLGGGDGESQVGKIEEPLNRAWTRMSLPQALNQSAETAHEKSLGIGKIDNADQDEEKIGGHRGLDSRQLYFQDGGGDSNNEEADIAEEVIGMPAEDGVGKER